MERWTSLDYCEELRLNRRSSGWSRFVCVGGACHRCREILIKRVSVGVYWSYPILGN